MFPSQTIGGPKNKGKASKACPDKIRDTFMKIITYKHKHEQTRITVHAHTKPADVWILVLPWYCNFRTQIQNLGKYWCSLPLVDTTGEAALIQTFPYHWVLSIQVPRWSSNSTTLFLPVHSPCNLPPLPLSTDLNNHHPPIMTAFLFFKNLLSI